VRLWKKIAIAILGIVIVLAAFAYWYIGTRGSREPSLVAWRDHCAGCHGKTLEGTAQGPALVGTELKGGDTVPHLMAAIANGVPGTTMSA
jgi:cytochrome c553